MGLISEIPACFAGVSIIQLIIGTWVRKRTPKRAEVELRYIFGIA